ncbi:hypothetical protein ACWGI8_14065 [Streptomyces sp. NPDC054841]
MRIAMKRMAVGGAAAVAILAGTATAAQAGDITISNSHGYMKYIDDGDMFQVCDTKADGYGVEGVVVNDTTRVLSIDDGGDAGCDKKGYNIGSSPGLLDWYQMQFSWSGGGPTVYSQKFDE